MRPEQLTPLFASALSIPGIGPRLITLLEKAVDLPPGTAEPRVIDLLWHTPHAVIDRRTEPTLAHAAPGTIATFQVRVLKHRAPPRGNRKAPYRVACEDDTGRIDLVFFHTERAFIQRQLPEGEVRYISGRVDAYGDKLQMIHPDYIVSEAQRDQLPMLEPVYGLTAGLSGRVLGKAIRNAVTKLPEVPEWQSTEWLTQQDWPSFAEALRRIHGPEDMDDISAGAAPRQRLAYDELFASQIALHLVRLHTRRQPGRRIVGDGALRDRIASELPFRLTGAQTRALREISDDLTGDGRMHRLLQGDVGSGKTLVALMTMAAAIEAGAQAALMAPTEVLARQHTETIGPLADKVGIDWALLTGREKGKTRTEILQKAADGTLGILIGTHALFQPDVVFQDLGVAIIDEQHRFGVHQRLALQSKGRDGGANVLAMTATPIPRTLLMTHYGDLDVSRLDEKPAGRKPIKTTLASQDRLDDVIEGLRRQLEDGAQVYWVCPLIEGTGPSEMSAAQERAAHLNQIFPNQVGLVHGAMSGDARDKTMRQFTDATLKILVATTVIEVGVNVPNAAVMVIEHAERFGLAQLHQLRGRVGRGERQSYCVLLYRSPLSETAEARLRTMRETEDGFIIAEKDLDLRGGGELLGWRQSGMPSYRVAEVPGANALLEAARDDAQLLLQQDPKLTSERGAAVRQLLYLFECDEAARLFHAA
ncbi:MAG: ATP-dependent DNA helicase RecG [Pseudomonadota bacterium]